MAARETKGFDSRRARGIVAAWLPSPCCRCGDTVTATDKWTVDHYPVAQRFLEPEEVNDPATWQVAHASCNYAAGGRLKRKMREAREESASLARKGNSDTFLSDTALPYRSKDSRNYISESLPDPSHERPYDYEVGNPERPAWWPQNLIDERANEAPGSYVPPRVESPHHPDAVGTYLHDFIEHVDGVFMGIRMRAWQLMALARLLEHDSEGNLCWSEAAVSTSRQVGKSVLLKSYAWWRLQRGHALWGEQQHVVNIANRLALAHEFWGSAKNWVKDDPSRGDTYMGPGRETIFSADGRGSRWQPRSTKSAYGYTLSMPLLDEVWDLKPEVVDEMLLPTMLAVRSPQMVLASTAHENTTTLFPRIRENHLKVDAPLLLEWSAPRDCDITDVDAWRLASPAWTEQRRKFLYRFLETTPASAFRTMYLNVWPSMSQREEDRYTLNDIHSAPHNGDPLPSPGTAQVAVIEATPDLSTFSAVVATSWEDDGMYFRIWHSTHRSLGDAIGWIAPMSPPRVVVGLSLRKHATEDKRLTRSEIVGVGMKELRLSVPHMMSALREKRVFLGTDDAALIAAADNTRVKITEGGQLTLSHSGGHAPISPVKCLSWALLDIVMNPATKPAIW